MLEAHSNESCRYGSEIMLGGVSLDNYQFIELPSASWGEAATVQNSSTSIGASGIQQFNSDIIPNHAVFIGKTCPTKQHTPRHKNKWILQNN
ncbi:hypothetical protein JTB14_018149 [Gonioctena quinquepunctata]|nr:hypothetical protein JTB14_018149 [Gonioctena quinquepunctata]